MKINEECIRDILIYMEEHIIYNKKFHKFLETIKPELIWNKTKSIISKVGVHTLNFIEDIAHDVAVESAKQAVTIAMTQK